MNHCLLYPKDYDQSELLHYSNRVDLITDFRLDQLAKYMSKKDSFIESVMLRVMMIPLPSREMIFYRHEVIKDCMEHRKEFDELYEICGRCILRTNQYIKENFSRKQVITSKALLSEISIYQMMIEDMIAVQGVLDEMQMTSKGMKDFKEQMVKEHGKYPTREIQQLKDDMLALEGGSANQLYLHLELGLGFKLKNAYIEDIVVDSSKNGVTGFIKKSAQSIGQNLFKSKYLDLSDVSVREQSEELRIAVFEQVHKIYMEQIRRTMPFFEKLRSEIAFYLGVDNYYHAYRLKSLPMCFPHVLVNEEKEMRFKGLYEPLLGFTANGEVVTNDCEQRKTKVTVISGANQGGKSTYLKSIGIAQIFMQCGMMVNAEIFASSCYNEVFSHFSRHEDKNMKYSRFEEELMRLNQMFEHFTKDTMVLLNESFASTTEQEGSQMADDLTRVLYDSGITMFFVSHLYQYTTDLYQRNLPDVYFLNAERKSDGTRTFKMIEQAPNHTSYGMDLFDEYIHLG